MPEFDYISTFLAHQKGRGFSGTTVKRRRSSLSRFARSIAPLDIRKATPELIEEWVHQFVAPATRHAYRSDIIAFYEWARRRKVVDDNPGSATDAIRSGRPLPRPVNPSLIPTLISSAPNETMRTWIALGARAGLRISEIAELQLIDIRCSGANPVIEVRGGKGAKDRIVPMHDDLVQLLGSHRRHGHLFRATGPEVGRWGAAYMRGIGVDATMHQLRHTFGTELARVTNGNVVLIAYLMGHASIQTTMGYIGWAGGAGTEAIGMMYPAIADEAA